MTFLLQHYSTPQCENYQWLHHCGPPSDASRAAPADGGPDNRAASQSALISSTGCQLSPVGFGPQHAHAVLYFSLAAVTHAVLLLTTGQSPWTPVCPDQNSEKHLIRGQQQHMQRRKGGQKLWNRTRLRSVTVCQKDARLIACGTRSQQSSQWSVLDSEDTSWQWHGRITNT